MTLEQWVMGNLWSVVIAAWFLIIIMLAGGMFLMMMFMDYFTDRGSSEGNARMLSYGVVFGSYFFLGPILPVIKPLYIICGAIHLSTITTIIRSDKNRILLPDWVKRLYRLDRDGKPTGRK